MTRGKKQPAIERLLTRCIERDGCWVFTGAIRANGYGAVGTDDGRVGSTHRVTYSFFIGEVPPGLDLDHLCRNRACCNPWHLDPVTRKVNANRGLRAVGYQDPACRKGHPYEAGTTGQNNRGRVCLICQRASEQRKKDRRRANRLGEAA